MKKIAQVICGECKFWHEVPPLEDAVNECHRSAPIPGAGNTTAKWPTTKYSDWCGEFKVKNEK